MVGLVLLVVAVLYLAACSWVAQRATARMSPGFPRSFAMIGVIVLLMLAPHVDGIYGYFRLKYLCSKESKSEAFGKISMPSKLFDAKGQLRFLDKYGSVNWSLIESYVLLKNIEESNYEGVSGLKRITGHIVRVSDSSEIARRVSFHYSGGWFRTNGAGLGAESCIASPSSDLLLKRIVVITD